MSTTDKLFAPQKVETITPGTPAPPAAPPPPRERAPSPTADKGITGRPPVKVSR